MEEGKLYIVATPIGNLGDITLRALKVLREVDIILAEDTRKTRNLLTHHGIPRKELISYFEGNEKKRIPEVLKYLKEGRNVALVSESGTPLISDPGFKLVRELISQNIPVEVVPGPTAFIAALTLSGLPPDKFVFLGFLPKKLGKAKRLLEGAKQLGYTTILYESPHRLLKTLHLLEEVFGEVELVVARELTKLHEEVRREKVSKSILHFNKVRPKGEFALLLKAD